MSRQDLQVQVASEGDTVTVALLGEVHFDFDAAEQHIAAIMARKPRSVMVDAAGLTFLSSVGMCFLINLRRAVREIGGVMQLKSLRPLVRNALERAHVIHLFEVLPDSGNATT
jgi:anti-anti-sigma factor